MKIDAHHHLWDLSVRGQDWINGAELAPINRSFLLEEFQTLAYSAGVDASVLVQTVCVPAETPELLAAAAESELIQAVTGWVDLEDPAISATLEQLRAGAGGEYLRAIRHQVQAESDPDWLRRADVRRGISAVGRAGLQYEFVVRAEQLATVAETIRELPDVGFILDHAGKPPIAAGNLRDWHANIATVASAPNVVCKISGLVTEASWNSWRSADLRPVTDQLLEVFGPNRLMLGSDWPVSTLAADYQRVWSVSQELIAELSESEQRAVQAGTAAAAYRIPGAIFLRQ